MKLLVKKVHVMVLVFLFNFSGKVFTQDADSLAKDPVLFLQIASKHFGWNEPADPVKIAGPIYFVGTKGLASYLITGSAGYILLYTAMPNSGPMIETSIRKLGFNPEEIKFILTGHAHIDHVGGHAYIKKISGARVVIMESEKDLIESGGKTDFHYGNYPEFYFEPVKADLVIRDQETIKLGDISMTALHTPGHTRGGTTWVMNVSENGKVYNVVFPDGTSINPGYRVNKDPSYPGIEMNFRNTLHTLEMLKPDIWLSSHTDFFNFAEKRKRAGREGVNAWADPEGYRLRIAGEREKFEAEINKELGIQIIKKNKKAAGEPE
jgi:metallo-beta-lactamase class B